MLTKKIRSFPFLVSIGLFFIPSLFWNGGLYAVGGDDSRLYYLFPMEMVRGYLVNIVSDNILSSLGVYGPQLWQAPFFFIIHLTMFVGGFLNTQLLLYGFNLSVGFLSFYLLLGIVFHDDGKYSLLVKTTAGLFYVLSIFSFYTLWNHQLFSLFLVAIFPLMVYMFIRAILWRNFPLLVFSAITISIFSILIVSIPWAGALLISTLPTFGVIFLKNKKIFLKYSASFLLIVFLLNFYWIFHVFYSPLSVDKEIPSTDIISNSTSVTFRNSNSDFVRGLASLNDLSYPFFNLFHKKIQENFDWQTYQIFTEWHLMLLPLNLSFLVIVLTSILFLKNVKDDLKVFFLSSLSGWLVSLFLFTANIGTWGVNIFVWLSDSVPGFVMFRNMYDKFGLAMAFSYAFLFGISLKIVSDNIRSKGVKWCGALFFLSVVLFNAKPFVFGDYFRGSIWKTTDTYSTISDLNEDFYSLAEWLKGMNEPSRFLWLPLNNANYVQIRDKNLENHYYSGVSPLQFLANKSDFNGKLSFPSKVSEEMFQNIKKGDYESIGKDFQRFNVEHIIVNNDISPDLQQSYLFGQDLYDSQMNDDFMRAILGPKVKDFGERYSLYEIHPSFRNEKIYLTEDLSEMPDDFSRVDYRKIASSEYRVTVKGLKGKEYLVFLDPYHRLWEWYVAGEEEPVVSGTHHVVFEYANGWEVDADELRARLSKDQYHENPDGSIDVDLALYFKPQDYFYPGLAVSGVTLVGSLGYLGWYGVQKLRLLRRKKEE